MSTWKQITVLGGLPFTMMVFIAIAIALLTAPTPLWRVLVFWCTLFSAALVVAGCSQIAFLGWGIGAETISFAGFSGHATRAAAVMPAASFIMFLPGGRWPKNLSILVGFIAAALVAISRVIIGAHSSSEAAAGFLLGVMVALAFIREIWTWRGSVLTFPLLALFLAAPIFTVQPPLVHESMTHQWLIGVALNLSGHDRPYSRTDWKLASTPYVPPCAIERIRFHYLCI